ncbi:MAG TPA: VOC family protein [Xanthobacteraceae bacterium]
MITPELTHVGILVENLAADIERYSRILGLHFRPPNPASFAIVEEGGASAPAELWMTYSMEGPPYVELMQATGSGVWSAAQGFGLHHIGGFASELAQWVRRFEQLNLEPEARIFTPGGELLIVYFRPSGLMGTRYELISDALRPQWASWVAGGPPPGHN